MASAPAASEPPEVFQASIVVERSWVREVVRAVLGTILFYRVAGNLQPASLSVAGVTFPTTAEPELDELISAKVELLARLFLDGPPAPDAPARRAKLFVSLYPTPLPSPPPPSSSRSRRQPTPSGTSRTASPAASDARTGPSPTRRTGAVTLAQAAPAAVSSALGWFSASARAALSGTAEAHESLHDGSAAFEGQEDELRTLELLEGRGVKPWEGWCVEIEVLGEAQGGRSRAATAGEERLRAQLHDFLLRSLEFTMLKTAHVPPITTTERMPYGILILVSPSSLPFTVPRAVVKDVEALAALHRALVAAGPERGGTAAGASERRATSVGGRW
ncbi:hypothetical protein JCM9279_007506 [Rhodotorula babjevae]